MRKENKGFTIVELVIVIAVIAILAAVLIPTFSGIIQKANLSVDVQTCKNMNITLATESITEKPTDIFVAKKYLRAGGYSNSYIPKTDSYHYYWFETSNTVYLVNDKDSSFDIYFPIDEDNAIMTDNIDPTKFHRLDTEGNNYLTFTADMNGSTVTPNFVNDTWQYSTDNGKNWNDGTNYVADENRNVTSGTNTTVTLANKGDSVMLKGTNCVTNDAHHFSMTGKIAASGDVTSLTNGEGGDDVLTTACYKYMFYECTSLTTAPSLPATTLADECYRYMFQGCTSLEQAPNLPATTLVYECYYKMFCDCTSLNTAPELPAMTLAKLCYNGMFQRCAALTEAPNLPATTLIYKCYFEMFQGCTALTEAPNLPATTLADSCYYKMFEGCTSLQITTEKPVSGTEGENWGVIISGAKTTRTEATEEMFGNCVKTSDINATPSLVEGTTYYWYK